MSQLKVKIGSDLQALNYFEAKSIADMLDEEVSAAGAVLKKFPRLSNGLIPDDIRASNEYKAARATYDRAFSELRAFNSFYTKKFKREIQTNRRR